MNIPFESRRSFLKSITTVSGGLILGIDVQLGVISNACSQVTKPNFNPNVWIAIAPTGQITITVARSEMGQGIRTSLPMIVADQLDADWSKIQITQADADPDKYGGMGTGGSYSIRGSWSLLAKAGAAGREMLIAAAAKQWNTSIENCYAKNNFVFNKANKDSLSYGNLADFAGTMQVPESPKLKEPKDYKIIGRKKRRLDTPDKVNGKAQYGIDIKVPNMLFATIVRPTVFGATLKSYDASQTKNISGVKDVIQADDLVAVIGTSTWAAIKGREALVLSWDKGEYADRSSESITKMFEDAVKKTGDNVKNEGDAEGAFSNASKKMESVYHAPFAAHVPMEPMNCTAHVQGNKCEIWAPTQVPQDAQKEAANWLGIPVENVTLHITLMGGGFGRRLETDYALEAVKVSKVAGAPVKVVWTREDDMQHDFYRPATYNVLKGGLDASGNVTAWWHRVAGASAKGLVNGGITPLYAFPNLYIDSHILQTGVPIGAWRSVGYSQNCFVIESFVDELAHAAGKDPFEFRRNLLSKSPRLQRTLEYVADKAGWSNSLTSGSGKGIACCHGFGSSVAQVAEVSVVEGKIKIQRIVCAVDCGPYVNPDTIEAQIQGAIAFGLTASIKDEITIEHGGVKQESFDTYDMLRFDEMPAVEVYIVPSDEAMGGIGEPGVPPVAPAVCNAIFAATGKRIRKLPVRMEG